MATHTYRLIASYTFAGQFGQNILHYQFDDASYADTQSAALALCNAFDSANTAHLQALLCTHVTINSYKSRGLNISGGFEAVKLLGGPPQGTRAGVLSNAAVGPCVVLLPTGNAKQRGRVFLPGLSDGDLIDGDITAGYRTAFNTHKVMFTQTLTLSGGGAPTATPVVYSRLPLPSTSRIVEYAILSNLPATLFRRQRPA